VAELARLFKRRKPYPESTGTFSNRYVPVLHNYYKALMPELLV
jgi:hypothetical protein